MIFENSFLKDSELWEKIQNYLPNNPLFIQAFKKDLDYFRTEHFGGKYAKNPQNNKSVIEHFDKFLKKKISDSKFPSNSYVRVYDCFSDDAERRLIEHLKQLYPDD